MLSNLKALLVVLAIALPIFLIARPFMLRYVDPVVYARRRNVWVVLAVLGFTSPSIWLYALVAMPLMYWAAKKDDNPMALYVLLAFVIPNASVQIPTIGIGQLLELNQQRMMSAVILLPLMFRKAPVAGFSAAKKLTAMDWTLVATCVLQLMLVLPYDSPTTTARRTLIYFLDTFLVFYAFARVQPAPRLLREIFANIVLVGALLSALAIFESFRFWLLYIGIGPQWGAIEPFTAYIMRSGLLRSQVTTGHSLQLGYVAAMTLGVWFYMSSLETRMRFKLMAFPLLMAGVYVSGSRGAWITAMIAFAAYAALRPNAGKFIAKALPVIAIGLVVAFNSPLKDKIIDKLPIIGKGDQDTVEYRQQVAEVSWRLIKQNPFFGDPFAMRYMQELVQGQGIIDMMNGYANVAVFNGGVGFLLFVGTFAIALWRCFFAMRQMRGSDPDMGTMGAMLIACMLASLFFIGTAAVHTVGYWLAGLMAVYANIAAARAAATAQRPVPVSSAPRGTAHTSLAGGTKAPVR